MREIKFRAWIREGEWDEAGENQAYKMCYDLAFEDFEPINDLLARVENLMQYTGLKDKNDKEIYEGDVIDLLPEGYVAEYAKVEWNEAESCWMYRRFRNNQGIYVKWKPVEVVGNIYESPALMKV